MKKASPVVVLGVREYSEEIVYPAVEKGMEMIGARKLITRKGMKVLLKINLLSPTPPSTGIDTHPLVVGGTIRVLKKWGCEVWVGDAASTGDMGAGMSRGKDAFDIAGIREVAEKEGATIKNFNREGYREVEIKSTRVKKIHLAEPLFQADLVFSLPKFKTHELTFITGAVKNFFGCIPSGDRNLLHLEGDPEKFSSLILDLFQECPCHLSIMDGIEGMEGEGPARGEIRRVGVLLFSRNPHALDAIMARIMGFHPREIPLLYLAEKRGWVNLDRIEVKGEKWENFLLTDFQKPSTFLSARKRKFLRVLAPLGVPLIDTYPRVRDRECKKCGLCRERCPVSAIKLIPFPRVNYEECIRCYTCIEICPYRAFYPEKSWLTRILQKIRS